MDSPVQSKRALNSRINISNSMIKDKSCLLNNTLSNSEANNQSMMSNENQVMSSYDSTVSKMKMNIGEKGIQEWERKFVNINTLLKEKSKRRTLSRLYLEQSNANGSTGYYVFESVGTQGIVLEVTDPDGIMVSKKQNVDIKSVLSVEAFAFPRVVQR